MIKVCPHCGREDIMGYSVCGHCGYHTKSVLLKEFWLRCVPIRSYILTCEEDKENDRF